MSLSDADIDKAIRDSAVRWQERTARAEADCTRQRSDEWEERWLSPCTLLEMHREVRSNGFFVCFGLTLLVGIVAMLAPFFGKPWPTVATTFPAASSGPEEQFWTHVAGLGSRAILPGLGLVFLVAIPIFAFIDFCRTSRRVTLEPLLITRVRAKDVLAGKWDALNFQIALIATTLMPALTLRYYRGGGNPLEELLMLANLGVLSSLLCGVALMIASEQRVFWRLVVLLGVVFLSCMGWWLPMMVVAFQIMLVRMSHIPGLAGALFVAWFMYSLTRGCIISTAVPWLEGSLEPTLILPPGHLHAGRPTTPQTSPTLLPLPANPLSHNT